MSPLAIVGVFVLALLAWSAVAVILAVVIGEAIRLADEHQHAGAPPLLPIPTTSRSTP